MKYIRQQTKGYEIPRYMQDILTNNYCPFFLRMSMVREDDRFTMKYQTDRFRKLEIGRLDDLEKLILLRTLLILGQKNQEWLIGAENYMLEPEYIYSTNNSVSEDAVKVLFYPDYLYLSLSKKLVNFSKKIRVNSTAIDIFIQFEEIAARGDLNRTRMFLDKNILRMETNVENVV